MNNYMLSKLRTSLKIFWASEQMFHVQSSNLDTCPELTNLHLFAAVITQEFFE